MKIKITPDSYFIILLITSVLFHYVIPISKVIYYPYSLIGIIFVITGIIIAFATNAILLNNRTSIKPFQSPSILITSGPFRFSRNPIYLSMTIILFGVVFALGSLSPFISPVLFVIIINKSVIPDEEHNLKKLFGEQYLNYKIRVRRWL